MCNPFPKDFLWGASTASAQIEGAWNEEGRTPSIWDVTTGEQVLNGQTCHVACDHYHRFREDVAIMKELGLKSYRFSVSWSRVIPAKGKINPKGIEFYVNLVKELRSADIEPLCTIYHWDLPLWVHNEGGWKNPEIIALFRDYTKVVVDTLSAYVTYWGTFNEPQCFIPLGYEIGYHAPFLKEPEDAVKQMVRHMLLAHGEAVKVIRKSAKTPPKIGIAMAVSAYVPLNETQEGIANGEHLTFEGPRGMTYNGIYADPIFLKKAPEYMADTLSTEDLERIAQPLDYLGINVYQPMNHGLPGKENEPGPDAEYTSIGYLIDERCMYWSIRLFHERYHVPIMVTENGVPDNVAEDGSPIDNIRADFLRRYLGSMKRALGEGYPVIGYQLWSLMDNFEWAMGYGPRLGIVHIDYETQKRTVKESGRYYARVIACNGANI